MNKEFVSLFVTVILLSIISMAQGGNNEIKTPVEISINTAYLGDSENLGFAEMMINITTSRQGHMAYIEEYYAVDSENNPKHVLSIRHYDDNVTSGKVSFKILRPFGSSGRFYSLIRGAVLLNGKRVYEEWIKTIDGVHLTYSEESVASGIGENIDKFETKYAVLFAGYPKVYEFSVSELAIYDITVTSFGNENNVPLRVELLKDVPISARQFPGAVYKYIDVSLDVRQIKTVSLRYKVENSWIDNNDISGENIKLFRWDDKNNRWYGLKTVMVDRNDSYTYYESETTNMSLFAIASLRNIGWENVLVDNVESNKVDVKSRPMPTPAMSLASQKTSAELWFFHMKREIEHFISYMSRIV